MPPWIPESEIEAFVGSAALGRARGYLGPDRVRGLTRSSDARTVTARLKGSGTRWYTTEVRCSSPLSDGSVRRTETLSPW